MIDGEPLVYFDHQLEGVRWLLKRWSGLLADQPGLGKSLQSLTAAAVLREQGKVNKILVICSKSLQGEWEREHIGRLTNFTCMKLNGTTKPKRENQLIEFDNSDTDILIIGYEQVVGHLTDLSTMRFDLVIVDEATAVKNPKAKRTKAVMALLDAQAARWYLLTATPVLNNPGEIWALLKLCDPINIIDWWPWKTRFCMMGGFKNKIVVGVQPTEEANLRKIIERHTLRRNVDDCLDLPGLFYVKNNIRMNPQQAELYGQVRRELKEKLAEAMKVEGAIEGKVKAQAMVAAGRLTQLCSTPGALPMNPDEENSADYRFYPDNSTKLDKVTADIVKLSAEGEKVVLGSRFKMTLSCLERRLRERGIPTYRIDGDVSLDDREVTIDMWKSKKGAAVFMGTFKTISEGLNLTEASNAFLVDPLFVPGEEWQFIKRIHRIGMNPLKPAYIHTYVTENTYEERIEEIKEGKEDMFASTIPNAGIRDRIFDAIYHSDDFDLESATP